MVTVLRILLLLYTVSVKSYEMVEELKNWALGKITLQKMKTFFWQFIIDLGFEFDYKLERYFKVKSAFSYIWYRNLKKRRTLWLPNFSLLWICQEKNFQGHLSLGCILSSFNAWYNDVIFAFRMQFAYATSKCLWWH